MKIIPLQPTPGKSGIMAAELDPEDAVLPCPFCGGRADLSSTYAACYGVKCQDPICGAEVGGEHAAFLDPPFPPKDGIEANFQPEAHLAAARDALARWNRRQT